MWAGLHTNGFQRAKVVGRFFIEANCATVREFGRYPASQGVPLYPEFLR